jgi:FHA domain-containing protein
MARLICADPECGAAVGKTDPVCWSCGVSLLEDGATIEAPADPVQAPAGPVPAAAVTVQVPVPAVGTPGGTADRCPNCGAVVPDSAHLVCLECLTELSPADRPAAATAAPGSADSYATVRERGDAKLTVTFTFGTGERPVGHVELSVGQEVLLGRDASDQRLACLHDKDNVSRRHATIGLTPRGAWVRDEESTNGTFVNGRRVAAGEATELAEGAELRLASDVRGTVRLSPPGEPGHG